ncbi:MAG: Nif3-like dinuclear metal center hexameric protein [Ruminococcaceae bacterium]|nr:Nif3-like dinuclear metal center hexameric protein [Oscillospiraceae bacterium]
MTTIKDILNFTETFAPLCTAADFDNCGVLVGSTLQEVTKVLLALDITKEVAEEAKNMGAQLIISHHPVIFNPLKALTSDSIPYLLAQFGITALCLHTNLDIAENCGVNVCLANALSLSDTTLYAEDFLLVGKLPEAMSVQKFARFVKTRLGATCVAYTDSKRMLKTLAMCSGAGADFYALAKEKGADVFLTGEAKHHEYLDAAACDIPLVTAGHFHTEDVVITPLKEKLSKKFANVEFVKSKVCKNPYFCV